MKEEQINFKETRDSSFKKKILALIIDFFILWFLTAQLFLYSSFQLGFLGKNFFTTFFTAYILLFVVLELFLKGTIGMKILKFSLTPNPFSHPLAYLKYVFISFLERNIILFFYLLKIVFHSKDVFLISEEESIFKWG